MLTEIVRLAESKGWSCGGIASEIDDEGNYVSTGWGTDVLMKAVEAVRAWARDCCCLYPCGPGECRGRSCIDHHACGIAHAVLEAAGYDRLLAVAQATKTCLDGGLAHQAEVKNGSLS